MLSILLQLLLLHGFIGSTSISLPKMVHFMTVYALFFGYFRFIFGVRTVLELNSAYFSDFPGVSGYFMLHFITLGDENKTKKQGQN